MKSAFFFYSLFVLTTLISTLGCESQIKKTVYSAYEKVGIYKRDILKDRIEDTKGSQEDAKEEFTSAYDKLKTLYNHDGGDLEAKFRKFSSSYDDAEKRAQRVHTSIAKMDGVANDLFKEWQAEIQEISDSKFASVRVMTASLAMMMEVGVWKRLRAHAGIGDTRINESFRQVRAMRRKNSHTRLAGPP
mgnify:CR=1 FL=1